MPIEIPLEQAEVADRRQITSVEIGVMLDTGDTPVQLPTLQGTVSFTDIYRDGSGNAVPYPVAQTVSFTHEELLLIPHALEVIAAIRTISYQKMQSLNS